MAKQNLTQIGLGVAALGVVGFLAHRMGYTKAYKEATINCNSLIALNTQVQPPATPASEISGLFGRF
jgi:hypothetical protein